MSDSEFTWTISNDPVDESSIVITGSATVSYTGMVTIFNQEKLCFSIDLEVGGTVEVTVETASTQYTLIESYEPYEPLDLSELTWEVLPDCGTGTGEILFDAGTNQTPVVWIHVPFIGTQSLNLIEDLVDSTYTVGIEDLYCPIDTLISGIVVPDGSLSLNFIDIVDPLECVNADSTASGSSPGKIVFSVDGGSGNYETAILPETGVQINGSSEFAFVELGEDDYTVFVLDTQTGCSSDELVELVMGENNFEINLEEVIPIVVNSLNTLQEGSIEVSVTTDNDFGLISYTWLPSGGDASISGIYSDLDIPGTYTVEASNNACTAELNINLDEFECNVPGDFNHDGIVNIADLLLFINFLGTSCSGCPQDFNQNGLVEIQDQIAMLSLLGLTWQTHCGF